MRTARLLTVSQHALGRWVLYLPRGGGVPAQGGVPARGVPAQVPPPLDRQTPVKT